MMVPEQKVEAKRDSRDRSEGRGRARRRRRRAAEGVQIAVNIAPMIDVTFLLLIFFLVTTTFERAEGILTSDLPRTAGTPSVALPLSPIVVRLEETGSEPGDFAIRIDRFDNRPTTFAELTEALHAIHEQPGFDIETPVVIVAEDGVLWDHVVACWNAALRAECENVIFAQP